MAVRGGEKGGEGFVKEPMSQKQDYLNDGDENCDPRLQRVFILRRERRIAMLKDLETRYRSRENTSVTLYWMSGTVV
jgi:hypothetical protein